MAREVIWKHDVHAKIYKRLVDTFGARDTWQGNGFCPPGETARMNKLYEQLAKELTDASGIWYRPTTVQQQVKFGLTEQPKVRVRQSRQFILNKAAAVVAGLIRSDSLQRWFSVDKEMIRQFIIETAARIERGELLAEDTPNFNPGVLIE